MMLGTYRLQDPNGRELATLVHGNRLTKANISTGEQLRNLWAAPRTKDQLRRLNLKPELQELLPSDNVRNSELLEQYLLEDDTDDVVGTEPSERMMVADNPSITDFIGEDMDIEDTITAREIPKKLVPQVIIRQAPRKSSRGIQKLNSPRVPKRRYK
jgi:hypothetical protein